MDGWSEDANAIHRFDSSVGRGDFQTKIGVGQVIKGESSARRWLVMATDKIFRLG